MKYKKCVNCGGVYTPTGTKQKYCPPCAHNIQKKQIQKNNKIILEKKRIEREKRQPHMECKVCGIKIYTYRKNAIYCHACSHAVNKERSKISQKIKHKKDKLEWDKLSDEEQLRRMNLISKKMITEEYSNNLTELEKQELLAGGRKHELNGN